ncbi:transporter substrate-binding protein [Oscillatoria sp. FACHB-1406]|uniref:transporter substrate-binding protein n=1 Tax=Oscillatoria sp. FACHB-1406 TaxID=2692846 RepID=UPI001687F6FC|nr:transporter substrate-binding protein [Oscillatoria sp. FACHB-1406]MBD2577350.1 transporter substrate-binding protein [Oscillatoria sp. FACHB-1406]
MSQTNNPISEGERKRAGKRRVGARARSKSPRNSTAINSTVPVGILHSLTGTMAIGEPSLKDATLMAIAEINQAGGILGKTIEPLVVDGASEPAVFARAARQLLRDRGAVALFGCWTSASRKAVIPVLEEHNGMLWYPLQYEGLEESPHVFYTGSCPNQQIEPAVRWLLGQNRRRFYLVGSDYVFPRTIHKIIRAELKQKGGVCLGEHYVPLGTMNFEWILKAIAQAEPDVIFSTLNGDSNIGFYQSYRKAGLDPEKLPTLAVSVAEEELRQIGEAAMGHYASWSYFQSLATPENQTFVRNFKAMYGADRVTSDPIEAAYTRVYLWKAAVEAAGSFESDRARQAAWGLTFTAPGGRIFIDKNQHLWKPCRIGRVSHQGQFEIVWDSQVPIAPQPWLGLETWDSPQKQMSIDLLAEVSQGLHHRCELEAKSGALNLLMLQLLRANQRLSRAQEQLRTTQKQYREFQEREKLLKKRLTTKIRSSLSLKMILTIAVEEIANLLDLDCCRLLWYLTGAQGQRFQPAACAAISSYLCNLEISDALEGLGSSILQISCMVIDDIDRDPQLEGERRARLQAVGLQALLIAPIRTRSGQDGLIVCEQYQKPRNWTDSDRELLKAVVDQLAIAIDQAQLYEESKTAAILARAKARELESTLEDLKETQAQLIQTEKMSALGMSLAGIAHEIKNPVNFICGNLEYTQEYVNSLIQLLELYRQHFPNPPQAIQDYAEEIEIDFTIEDLPKTLTSMSLGAERIEQLVLSLRNFSRTDRDRMEAIDLHDGIDSTLLILSNRLKAKAPRPEIEVIKNYTELPLVDCYPSQINQVFMNILGNAIDALEEQTEGESSNNPSHHPRITISTEVSALSSEFSSSQSEEGSEEAKPPYAIVRIRDNGSGIPPESQKYLFDPFYTTKPIGKGTGLGLAIGRKIVEETHNGLLTCQSDPETGTEFAIAIPLNRSVI